METCLFFACVFDRRRRTGFFSVFLIVWCCESTIAAWSDKMTVHFGYAHLPCTNIFVISTIFKWPSPAGSSVRLECRRDALAFS